MASTAASTDFSILTQLVQRQMLPAKPNWTCSAVGFGSLIQKRDSRHHVAQNSLRFS